MDQVMIKQFAELLYIENTDDNDRMDFKNLTEASQKKWMTRAIQAFEILEKMNKMVVPLVEAQQAGQTRQEKINKVSFLIREFNLGIKSFKKELYPVDELAMRIVDLK